MLFQNVVGQNFCMVKIDNDRGRWMWWLLWLLEQINEFYVITECGRGKFLCDEDRCWPERWVCDGFKHCWDGTDEDPDNCIAAGKSTYTNKIFTTPKKVPLHNLISNNKESWNNSHFKCLQQKKGRNKEKTRKLFLVFKLNRDIIKKSIKSEENWLPCYFE